MLDRLIHPLRWSRRDSCLVCLIGYAIFATDPAVSLAVDDSHVQIDGTTLDVWRTRMNELNLTDPASARFVPGLIEIVQQPDVPWFTRRQAALTLGRLGHLAPAGLPVLTRQLQQALDTEDRESALWAAKGLGLYGRLAGDATPTLIAAFQHPSNDRLLQMTVLDTLSQIGPAHPRAIPYLIHVAATGAAGDVADDPAAPFTRENLQQAAIEALGLVGAPASTAIPALIRLFDHPNDSLRREAATALGRMGPSAEIAITSLLERLVFDTDPAVQDQAATALASIGASSAGSDLAPLLSSDERDLRLRVLGIFEAWGSTGRPWRRDVETLTKHADPLTHLAAMSARLAMQGPHADWTPQIVADFRHTERAVRRRAYLLFEKLGPIGCSEMEALRSMRDDPHAEVRAVARKALAHCQMLQSAE